MPRVQNDWFKMTRLKITCAQNVFWPKMGWAENNLDSK